MVEVLRLGWTNIVDDKLAIIEPSLGIFLVTPRQGGLDLVDTFVINHPYHEVIIKFS